MPYTKDNGPTLIISKWEGDPYPLTLNFVQAALAIRHYEDIKAWVDQQETNSWRKSGRAPEIPL